MPFNRLQRGSTNWPFVIVLLALLVFIYMWWTSQDERDTRITKIDKQEKTIDSLRVLANSTRKELTDVSKLIGWNIRLDGNPELAVDAAVTVDQTRLIANLEPAGVMTKDDATIDGFMKTMIASGFLQYDAARRTGTPTGEAKTYKYATMSDELKGLLKELASTEPPAAPIADHDPDDAAAQDEYDRAKSEFDAALEEWRGKIAKAVAAEGFKEYDETITTYGISDPDEQEIVRVLFMTAPTSVTVEGVFEAVSKAPAQMKAEIDSQKLADVQEIARLKADMVSKETELSERQTAIDAAADTYATDIAAKEAAIQAAQEELSTARLAAQTAANQLAKEQDDRRKDVARLTADKNALQEGVRLMKQKRELIIRRDDPDGSIVASNPTLNTATIDLGYSDKVYVGQRFNVSARDKVGDRISKGTIMVVRVTGDHSARVRIQESWDTITQGDFIHNPLYSPTDTIHVFFAGPMSKWPQDMAKGRLAAMGVILQSAINGDTDYIVVPNAWTVVADTDGDEEDDDEEDVGAKSPLEKIEGRARVVGATVITERLFDSFLAY